MHDEAALQEELEVSRDSLRRKGDVIARQEEELAHRQAALEKAAHEFRTMSHGQERLQADLEELQV